MKAQFLFTAIATRIAGISVVGLGVGLALSACSASGSSATAAPSTAAPSSATPSASALPATARL